MPEFYDAARSASTSNYDLNGHISTAQRFRGDRTCPICKGSEDEHRGNGSRCYGFVSSDGEWCHCTREDHAGQARINPGSNAYQHKLKGKCPCGTEHAPAEPRPTRAKERPGTFDRAYDYHDAPGHMSYQCVRFKDPKGFAQRRPLGDGKWAWNLSHVDLVLYRRPELLAADPAEVVVIVEGEKDVDRLRSLGFVATCNPMGAGKWRPQYVGDFRNRKVVIFPDNDQVGRDHALDVARSLSGIATEVKIVELPDVPEKGDVSDFLDGRGGATLDQRVDELRQLIDGAPLWTPPQGPSKRPEIEISVEAHEVIDQAVAALSADLDVYQRGNTLVRVARDPIRARGFSRPPGSPRITPVPPPTLFEKLSRYAAWIKPKVVGNGMVKLVPALPPDYVGPAVAARGEWPNIRLLEAVIEAPTLRIDGTPLDQAGYDAATGLLLVPNAAYPAIPDRPTREDAQRAAQLLLDLVADFPFAEMFNSQGESDHGATHRSVWLVALLTVLAKFAIGGPAPLFAFDAPTPAAGKTLLVEIISRIAFGRSAARTTFPDDDSEMRKRITAMALAGDLMMLLDNVASLFGGPALDAALTGTTWRDRVLCRSEMTPDLPLYVVWCSTGNNFQFRGDFLRRVVHSRLDPKEERPEERDPSKFKIKEPLPGYVSKHRPALVAAGLTILRAYVVAGRPDQHLLPMDFREWSDLIRSAVHWTIGVDPCATRKALGATDAESNDRATLIHGWAELPGSDKGLTTLEALQILSSHPDSYSTLRTVLTTRSGDLPSPRSVGMRLTAIRGRIIGERSLKSVNAGNKTLAWLVVDHREKGTEGTEGTNFPHAREKSVDSGLKISGRPQETSPPSTLSTLLDPDDRERGEL